MQLLGLWTIISSFQLILSDRSNHAVKENVATVGLSSELRWSGWSQCSRDCDVGVTKSNATLCKSADNCRQIVRYKTCNEQPCPHKSVNFRDHLCSRYNTYTSKGREEWTSFYDSDDPCRLFCSRVGTAIVQKKDHVPDGTSCLSDNSAICLSGHCRISNCSSLGEECVICGGNDRLCSRYTWRVGHLAPCSVSCGKGVRITPVSCWDILLEKSVDVRYCKSQQKPEPRSKPCHRGPCKPRWIRGVWSLCSETCGSGITVRDVYCAFKTEPTYKKVSDKHCERRKPRSVASCNGPVCPTWKVGPWSKCSAGCGLGIQSRAVTCVSDNDLPCSAVDAPITTQPCHSGPGACKHGDTGTVVDTGLVDMQNSMQSDWGRETSKPRWKLLMKGPCSATCGEGIRALTYQCQTFDYTKRRYIILSDLKCLGVASRPQELERCHRATCYRRHGEPDNNYYSQVVYLWRYTGYGACSAPCLGGTKRATAECVRDNDRRPVSKLLCDPTSQPKDMVAHCNAIPCPPEWRIGNWTSCSATCGRGIETRSVECIQFYGRKASQVIVHPAYRCASIPPVKTRFCATVECPPKWYVGDWSSCTPLCGGLKMRQVECRMRNSNGSMVTLYGRNELRCTTESRPDAWAPCGEEDCRQPAPEPTRRSSHPEIRLDQSRFVQTKRRRHLKLSVGGVSTIIPGTRLSIRCPVRHTSRRDIIWFKEGKGRIRGVGRVRSSRKGYLRIHKARPSDAGVYTCRAGQHKANWTLLFHSAKHGENLLGTRKKYLNERAELKTPKRFPDSEKKFVLADAVRNTQGNHSVTPFDFVVGKWSPCSVTCDGKGQQIRTVTCEVIMEDYYKIVEDRLCTDGGLKKPSSTKMCEALECPQWTVGVWNKNCITRCQRPEFGTQYRIRSCQFRNGTEVKSRRCPQHDSPLTKRACHNKLCTATWKISTFSACSRTCGGAGVRTRMLRCVWKGSNKSAGDLCSNLPRPSLVRRCYTPPCSSSCRDSSSYCSLIKRLKLCRHKAYQKVCCATCRSV